MVKDLIDIRPHPRNLRPLTLEVVTGNFPGTHFPFWVRCQDYRPSGGDATPMFTVFDDENCQEALAGIKNVTSTADFIQLHKGHASIRHLSLTRRDIDGPDSVVIEESCKYIKPDDKMASLKKFLDLLEAIVI
eukprot:GEMP01125770.1.p2 GENE.GEMP01125770.1~~GEMP01125770.1.p2  ORF type:complete len:133 (+),score=26.04 GEMP01125770.1:59-457(+)